MDPPRSSSSTATEKDVGVTNTEAAAVGDVPTTTDGPVNAGAGAAEDSNTDLSNNDDGTPPDRPAVVPFADAAAAATQNAIFMSSVVVRVEEENATSNVLEADQQQEQQREEGRNKEHAPTATATEPCTSTPTTGLEEEEEVTPLGTFPLSNHGFVYESFSINERNKPWQKLGQTRVDSCCVSLSLSHTHYSFFPGESFDF